jgi:hypothetical protein
MKMGRIENLQVFSAQKQKGNIVFMLAKVKVSSFGHSLCTIVLANMPQNYKGTWRSHISAVCFSKWQKITMCCNRFFLVLFSSNYDKLSLMSSPFHIMIFHLRMRICPYFASSALTNKNTINS